MSGLYSYITTVSMRSKIPVPNVEQTEGHMRYVMCFFPLVELVREAVLGLWLYLVLNVSNLSTAVSTLVGVVISLLVTGRIHMDDFLDTMDAVHSYGDRSGKLEILRDPHLRASVVIPFGVYIMLYLEAFYEYLFLTLREEMGDRYFLYTVPCLVFVMGQAFSGLSVVTLPQAEKQGLAARFGGAAKRKTDSPVLPLQILICLIAGAAATQMGYRGARVLTVVLFMTHLAVFIWCYRIFVRQFDGVTGDLVGCFLQVYEPAGLTMAAVFFRVNLMEGMQE